MAPDGIAAPLTAGFDPRALPPAFYADPYPTYAALRRDAPVLTLPGGGFFLTRWRDLDAIYRDTATYLSDKRREFAPKFGAGTPLFQHHTTSLVFNDAPLHTRVRRIIAGALTPRAIAAMEPAVEALVDGLLDRIAAQGGADLIADFAAAIPVEVIGNLLGVPRAAREPLRDWSLAILGALEPAITADAAARGNQAVTQFLHYLEGLVAARRAAPGDPARDVLTRLLGTEADEGRLSAPELLHNCIFILNAGHETTTNLIGNALHLLLRHDGECARLLHEPALIRTAVEEVLRYESSNQLGNRRAARDVRVGDVDIPAGSDLTLCIGAANRDPDQFPDPDRFDVARSPNRHLAFAAGPHQCIGMSLARLEGRVAIGRFLQRFPRYRLAGTPVQGGRARFRGFTSIPVSVT